MLTSEYDFEEGQTWQQWLDSKYNTYGWEIGRYNYIYTANNETAWLCYNYGPVSLTDNIIEDGHYYFGKEIE